MAARTRPTCVINRAPIKISAQGRTGITIFGAPSPRACSGQAAPAAILDAPATRNAKPSTTEAIVATQLTKSDDSGIAFAGSEHVDAQFAPALDRLADKFVEHVVVVRWVVVKQREATYPGLTS